MENSKKIQTPAAEVSIRQALPEDAARLRLLRLEALQDAPQAFGADYETTNRRTVEWWEDNIRTGVENDEQVIYVAETGTELVGMTGIFRRNTYKTYHSGLIWGVYVKPTWRGLHIADALIQCCLEWGKAHGVQIARLGVINTNPAAIRCYLRCGFEIYGVEPMVIHWEGRYYDELLMARRL